ncbi:unnamed protein product [Cochlearia groenlandica]
MAPREPRRGVIQPRDQFGPYQSTLSMEKFLEALRRTCAIPEAVDLVLPCEGESPKSALPNFIISVLCALTVAEETGFAFGVPELMDLFSVRISKTNGTFAIYPNLNRNLVYGFSEKDSSWMDKYFFFRITRSSVGDMHLCGEKPRVSLVADWVLQKTPDKLNAVVALLYPEEDGEEEEEGLERRKRKRSSDDAGMSPRADVRTRSKSADPVRASEWAMRPPAIRSDRSA